MIPALFALTDYLCEPGDKVLGLAPSYGCFKHAAEHHGCEFMTSPLIAGDGVYAIDFADFEARASDTRTKLFFLCHPHTPTGRMWNEAELRSMAEICFRHGVTIVSDEIHCERLREGKRPGEAVPPPFGKDRLNRRLTVML